MDIRFLKQHHNTTKHLYKINNIAFTNNTDCAKIYKQHSYLTHTSSVADKHESVTKIIYDICC